jgi:hypothetical protein
MEDIRVATVEEAVQAAQELGNSDISYWFRGESKVRPLRSSYVRLNPEAQKNALEQLIRYESWLKDTPGVENLAANTDQAVAVAQHYGLPTNFLDFTASPEIAGFFASEKGGTDRAEEPACILCLDVEDLKEFCSGPAGWNSPLEFLELTVPDLWRLESQKGCFLFCPHDDIENLYPLDRIVFPNTHPLHGKKRGDVYPERKSAPESLLNQFFMGEGLTEWNNRSESIQFTNHFTKMYETPGDVHPDVFPYGLPEHPLLVDVKSRAMA